MTMDHSDKYLQKCLKNFIYFLHKSGCLITSFEHLQRNDNRTLYFTDESALALSNLIKNISVCFLEQKE